MKKFTSLLIGCSLALAGAAMAQQPDETASPTTKGKKGAAEKTTHAAEVKPGANAAKPEKMHGAEARSGANAAKPEETAAKQHGAANAPAGAKGRKTELTPKTEKPAGTETNVSGETAASATPGAKHQAGQRGKGKNAPAVNAKASPSATAAAATSTTAKPTTATTSASAAPSVSTAAQTGAAGAVKKVEPQKVQQVKAQAAQIKQQHATFRAQARPEQVPTVTFQQNYTIQGSNQWQGSQYEVFRSYHPERHDRGWYSSRYNRVELIGGGYYYWNNGYWYPAWGYDSANEYYAYDAPIYVGHRAEPPDRVIADVQAELQQMGYYTGEVDGLLGPLTREALTGYQADQGLTATAVIDQPTLDSLGMG
jgi:hypothetical protein